MLNLGTLTIESTLRLNCNISPIHKYQSILFGLAAATVKEQIKSRILSQIPRGNQIDKTDDFKFLSEECD